MIQIGICVFICAIKRKYKVPPELLPGNEIHAQYNCCSNIINVHSPLPKPSRPVTIVSVHGAVPKWNKCSRAKGNHVYIAVPSIILSNTLAQDLAAPVTCIRLIDAGCGNVYNFVDPERNGRLKNLEASKVPRTFRSKKS